MILTDNNEKAKSDTNKMSHKNATEYCIQTTDNKQQTTAE